MGVKKPQCAKQGGGGTQGVSNQQDYYTLFPLTPQALPGKEEKP